MFQHPDYNRGRGAFPNDVALLRLKTAADLSGANKAVALASASDNFDGQICVVSGWGHTEEGKTIFTCLMTSFRRLVFTSRDNVHVYIIYIYAFTNNVMF